MELCEHLKPYYQKEIELGNKVHAVGGMFTETCNMYVLFHEPMHPLKTIDDCVDFEVFKAPHYHWENDIWCKKCKMVLGFPYDENNKEPWTNIKPDSRIVVNNTTVIAKYNQKFSGIPTERFDK